MSNRRPTYRGFHNTGVGRLVIGLIALAVLTAVVVQMTRWIGNQSMSAQRVDLSGGAGPGSKESNAVPTPVPNSAPAPAARVPVQ